MTNNEGQLRRNQFFRAHPSVPLIVDVGANNGDDTDFYLRKGFRVFAIEADPDLAATLELRFSKDIEQGLCYVENVAVTDRKRPVTFYKNIRSEWSSTKKNTKATKTNSHKVIEVNGDTLGNLLEHSDEIYYIKTDIEGGEYEGIQSIAKIAQNVRYLSFELNPDWSRILDLVVGYHFSKFKLIRQGPDHLVLPPAPPREGEHVEISAFKSSMSGTFGKELPGEWLDYEGITKAIRENAEGMRARTARGEQSGWYDIHATR